MSLGFFEDVFIPATELQVPSTFQTSEQLWVWTYESESEDGTVEVHKLWVERNDTIRFRVTGVYFNPPARQKRFKKLNNAQTSGLMARNIFLLALFGSVLAASAISSISADWLLKKEFEDFKTKFQVQYSTPEEEAYRFTIFRETIERVAKKNKEHNTNVFGITKFADLTQDEFRARYLNALPKRIDAPVREPTTDAKSTSSFDWRSKGVVTPVKDQGYCGSCWAHSAVETVESAWALAGHTLTEFSVQQVTSCASDDYGCQGGWPYSAFEYIESAGGLATAASYPYVDYYHSSTTTACKSFTVAGGQVTGWSYATTPCSFGSCSKQDESKMINNLLVQPLSIVVDASEWSDYTSGVFPVSSCSSSASKLDHAVQLVGYTNYGSTSGYYIVRNSWGTSWGVDGYIYLPIGDNACGIADQVTMVTV